MQQTELRESHRQDRDINEEIIDDITRRKILRALQKPEEFGEIREFKVSELRSETTYQRAISEHWVEVMARNFDPRLLGTITVGLRAGNQNLVDGQHRHYLATLVGLKTLRGIALHTSSLREEAWLFVELNKNRRKPMGQQLFAAKLVAGDQQAIVINELVGKYKFRFKDPNIFSMEAEQDTITAIRSLELVMRTGGEAKLRQVLRTLRLAWDGDPDSLGRTIIPALNRFYERHDVSVERAAKAFGKLDAYSIMERGRRFAHRKSSPRRMSEVEGVVHVLESMV